MGKVILFVSAFVPMYILFLVNALVWLVLGHLDINIVNITTIVSLIILSIIGIVGLLVQINCKCKEEVEIKVISKKNLTDQHFLNYFSCDISFFNLSKKYANAAPLAVL